MACRCNASIWHDLEIDLPQAIREGNCNQSLITRGNNVPVSSSNIGPFQCSMDFRVIPATKNHFKIVILPPCQYSEIIPSTRLQNITQRGDEIKAAWEHCHICRCDGVDG